MHFSGALLGAVLKRDGRFAFGCYDSHDGVHVGAWRRAGAHGAGEERGGMDAV